MLMPVVDDENHDRMWLACRFWGLVVRLLLVVASMNEVFSPSAEKIVDGVASLFALFLGRLWFRFN